MTIQVVRCERQITRRALIVPLKKKHKYVLQDFDDPSHIFTFDDYTLESCSNMQDQGLKQAQEQLSKMRVGAMDVPYPWEKKMQSVNGFSMVYSMLVVPHAYADISMSQSSKVDNTVLQAITWLHVSKASGVPLIFRNVQTEPLITAASEQSSNVNLSSIVSSGTYSLEQSHGIPDRLVIVRAVRMWFAFHAAEVEVELEARQGENLLGVTIGRTIEGFCYVTEVVPNTAAFRVGLKERLDAAKALGMKLVVTKVGNERVLPWLISNGTIRCYDINSISSKLSAHRRAGKPACLHLLDIREGAFSTMSHVPEPMSTSSFGVEGNASTYMEF